VEWPRQLLPPGSVDVVRHIVEAGHVPVIAHVERYRGYDENLSLIHNWKRSGAVITVNAGPLMAPAGSAQRAVAEMVLRKGWVDLVASDYHARGDYNVRAAYDRLTALGFESQARLLLSENPGRISVGRDPVAVGVVDLPVEKEPQAPSFWKRLFGG